uniref:Retrovirus-related Pol polyprotein from transposon TNT 1-94 n=1 Tax=Tanacetum cinerariifolium TaxID=118510 RepID=A0A699HLN7_TANCI|nr:retrovirus-related Pol polyprotein from transposon TNT 1-94 [Tanacetum cinerariifolium]
MAIIDRQLPFENTITNRSTDAAVPLPVAPAANSVTNVLAEWNAIYDAYNEVTCLILSSMTPELHKQFENSSSYDMIKELKFMFKKQDGMKGNVDQLEHLGYMLSQDIIVGPILNGLTKDFVGFMRNYNMHNMEKTIGELHAMLMGYEKGLPKKAETPQVMMIKGEHPTKDDICHHCKEVGYWKRNCPVYLTELLKKKKQVGFASFSDYGILVSKNNVFYFNVIPSNGIYEIDMHDLVPNVNSIYNVSTKRDKQYLDSTYLWHYRLAHINKKHIEKLQQEGILKSTYDRGGEYISQEFKDYVKAYGIIQQLTPPYATQHNGVSERIIHTLLDMVRSLMNLTTLSLSFWDYALESATRILNMVLTKKVDKTLYELWYGIVPNSSYLKVWGCEALLKQDTPNKLQQRSGKCIFIGYPKEIIEVNERAVDLKEIQDEDTSPFEITSKILMEVEGFKLPQEEVILICRGLVDWKSFEQSTTAMSAVETKYIAASKATMEAVWIRKFILGLGPVRAFKLMKEMYGGFENVGATATNCKDFRRDLNLFIGDRDAQMVVEKLENMEK